MTLLEYFDTPETVLPQELIYGRMHVADAPSVSHQRIVLRLAIALNDHVEQHQLGEVLVAPVDVVLDRDRGLVLQPDLLFVSRDHGGQVLDRIYGAPDLVIEVLSPHPRIGRLDERIAWFAEHGVREIWLYDQPTSRLDILTCDDGKVISRASVVDGPISSSVLPRFTASLVSILGYV